MARAIALAWQGWGRVAPNPLVGAVVARAGKIVGEGWHAEYGGPHAEVQALRAAGDAARGATLVASLEPCAHQGKTPPCTEAILAAGVTRVVCAVRDPHPAARGGIEVLRAAGVTVAAGPGADAAAAQNAGFLWAETRPDRPFVALKLATSVDGRIADSARRSRWISGEDARAWVHWLRAGFDALAVGGATAAHDDPQLTVRGAITPRVPPVRIVFDRRAALPSDRRLVATARATPTWVVATAESPDADIARLEAAGVRVFRPQGLSGALAELRRAGVRTLLVEGGGALAARLIADGLVDRFYWVQSPLWLGERGVPAFPGLPSPSLDVAPRWIVVERRALGPDTLLVLDRSLCLPAS